MSKNEASNFEYEGGDLEAMMLADHYYKWITSVIKPYVGKRIVEVGAGVGSFSKFTNGLGPQQLILIEPSKSMYKILRKNTENFTTPTQLYNGYLHTYLKEIKAFKPDTFLYINVLEHVKDDDTEIREVANLLNNDGRLIIFVPALMSLYSEFDKSIDHYRRYTKKDLKNLCEKHGLEVEKLKYMDMPGIVPWWFSFVLMKRTKLVPLLVKAYDSVCIPIIRLIETIVPVPLGKNVLIIAKKK